MCELETRAGIGSSNASTPASSLLRQAVCDRRAQLYRNGHSWNSALARTHGRDQFKENWAKVFADSL